MTAGIYKFLVSDFLNPKLLPSGSAGSGEVYGHLSFHPNSSSESFIDLFS